MKSRLVMLLTLILSTASLVMFSGSSAQAATYTARLSQTRPIAGEVVRITGAINPAGRTLTLQRYSGGRWVRVTSTRTVSYGRYAFSVRALAASYSYRSYAPTVRIRNRTYGAAYSQVVRVTSVVPSLSLAIGTTPVAQNQAGTRDLTPAVSRFQPARPNATVAVQKLVNGAWTSVATAKQNASGLAYLQVPSGTSDSGTFRAYSRPSTSVRNTYSPWASATPRTLRWNDEFTGTALDPTKWLFRPDPRGDGSRICAQPAADRVTVASGIAQLSVRRTATRDARCPYGVWDNAAIEAQPDSTFDSTYGTYAARIKFNSSQGMHGAFWLQGDNPDTGTEIDVAEYFGDGRTDGGLTSYVHYAPTGGTATKSGGARAYSSILGAGRRPSSGWHVYSVDWSPSGYVFRLDGTPVLSTSLPHVATSPEVMILSLLTSDYELKQMKDPASTMSVDWVRVWQ